MALHTFTSESVAAGHPDKVADQVSDAMVDAALAADPKARVAVETLVTENRMVLAGEVTAAVKLDYTAVARSVVASLGYTDERFRFTDRSPVSVFVHEQSPDIAVGVDDGGAGDQGMMFGYACRETDELMPCPIAIAHVLTRGMDDARIDGTMPFLRPDGKSQVTVEYDGDLPVSVPVAVFAVPHDPAIDPTEVRAMLVKHVLAPLLARYGLNGMPKVIVNGTGKWEIGGPASDTGVTGRKIIVDTYGGYIPHGGGAFSGKDPTKVDRSGAYAARFIAKNVVAAKLADRCMVRLAYAIGQKDPVDVGIETFGTARKSETTIQSFATGLIPLSVGGIIRSLGLRRPIYRESARYGHFGRDGFPWERVVQ